MKSLKIGIATVPQFKARTLAIAAGGHKPSRSEPKLWFTSLEGLAKVLSEPNRRLLNLIIERRPGSLAELSELSGRAVSNLSRTIATMENYGLVRTLRDGRGKLVIKVPYRSIAIEVPFAAPSLKQMRQGPKPQIPIRRAIAKRAARQTTRSPKRRVR